MPRIRRQSTTAPVPRAPVSRIVHVTRQVHFNAAHHLHNPARSAAWNRRRFGLCNNAGGHGHNYVLEVTVRGEPDPDSGCVIEFSELKAILNKAVVEPCDHRNLNTQVPFLKGVIPSTENLVIAFWNEIEPLLTRGTLHCVRLYETPRNFAEYRGPAVT
ncbi:MAG: 6-carboxytetrahydropterin synthase [Opitutaceae bacterium]|nr:6-carboxytetrahydropterin synthase [Opitutaceae bacterium]